MEAEVLDLPHEIPVLRVERTGFAASANPETAMSSTGLPECGLAECILRGDVAPVFLGTVEGLEKARNIAIAKRESTSYLPSFPGGRGQIALGHLFEVRMDAGIAVPPPTLAEAMVRGKAQDVWDDLRPFAESAAFQGIDLPIGRVVFRSARLDRNYYERHLTSISARPVA